MRTRILLVAALLALAVAAGVPALYAALLGLDAHESLLVRYCLGAFGPLAIIAAAVVVMRLPASDLTTASGPEARRRVLELPARLALVFLGVALLVLTVLSTGLFLGGTREAVVLTLGLCTSALLALPVVPLYSYSRAALLPVATRLGDENRPLGRRVPLGVQVGYTVVVVAAAALVPASLFGASFIDRSANEQARVRATLAANRLARTSEKLDVAAATKLVTRTPLDGEERTLLVAPSGTHLPEDAGLEMTSMPYVEVPLAGALRGGTLRVYYPTGPRAHGPLLSAVLLLLGLTIWVAARASRSVTDDMASITRQIERVARDEPPNADGKHHTVSTAEVRRVALAVNRLLERIPRLTVESFLAIERATEAQRLKSQFLANMSHDLRSPLNSILGFSELLLRGLEGEIQAGQRVTLAAMHATGLRLLRLLNEILDTAKVESGKMELHRQSASPAELIRQAAQEARRGRAQSASERLEVQLQPGLQPIIVDPLRLSQVVTHLINHALDADAKGRVTLAARETATPRCFTLDLEYDGPPDPREREDERARLFDGFRLGGARPGLHLALPLARRLVEQHGGTLELLPAPAQGSTEARMHLRAVIPIAQLRRAA